MLHGNLVFACIDAFLGKEEEQTHTHVSKSSCWFTLPFGAYDVSSTTKKKRSNVEPYILKYLTSHLLKTSLFNSRYRANMTNQTRTGDRILNSNKVSKQKLKQMLNNVLMLV